GDPRRDRRRQDRHRAARHRQLRYAVCLVRVLGAGRAGHGAQGGGRGGGGGRVGGPVGHQRGRRRGADREGGDGGGARFLRRGYRGRRAPTYRSVMTDPLRTPAYELAQANVGRLKFPLDSPELKDFVDALDPVNATSDSAAGFVWRLQSDSGNATDVPVLDD